jgi:hypothetical protein
MILNSAIALGQYAEFSFDQKVEKFPKTAEGAILEASFHFENTGDTPLIISNHKVECPCTVVSYSKEPVPPGQEGVINVSFDTNEKIGWQYRGIELFANTEKSPEKVEIRVKVIPREE